MSEGDEASTDGRSPYQIACSELAAFKFRLIETVAADPRLKAAPCTEAIIVFAGFMSIDKRTLKPTVVYASNIKLMARGNMKSKTTARAARRLLVEFGYLVPTGSKTKDGCVKYRVENRHYDRVQMSAFEAERYWSEIEAERRREERRKQQVASNVGSDIDPTETGRGDRNCTDVGSDIDPNYHGGNLTRLCSEGGESYKVGSDLKDNREEAYPAPTNDSEAEKTLDRLLVGLAVVPAVRTFFKHQLLAGRLRPSMIDEQRSIAA